MPSPLYATLGACSLIAGLAAGAGGSTRSPASPQRIAVPSYFYPGPLWTQLEAAAPPVGLAIINPNSGPGTASNPAYVNQVQQTQARGITVLGYVFTQYGARPQTQVTADIDAYFSFYGVDGIFLDEVSTDCAFQSYYVGLSSYIKAKNPAKQLVSVLNPGVQTNECYMTAGDILVTFEGTYKTYTQPYAAPAWVRNYPASRFWHLVYATPTAGEMAQAIRLSKQRNAGWIYVTPADLPNPWDTLPPDAYWGEEQRAVQSSAGRNWLTSLFNRVRA